MARREGSPWTGVNVIARKVFADHLTSLRLGILEGLVFMAAMSSSAGMLRYPQTATVAPLLIALGTLGLMFAVALVLLQRRVGA